MPKLPILQLIAYEKETLRTIKEQLQEVGLGDHCQINASLAKVDSFAADANLYLITNESVYQMVKHKINPAIPVILAKRFINLSNIVELLSIPSHSEVYLVSNMQEAAQHTIYTLSELGINHKYIPYYGQENIDPSIEYAITAGEVDYVPKTVKQVVNLGHRWLDMTTIMEVYDHFNIPTYQSTNRLTARYLQTILPIIEELYKQVLQTRGFHKSLIHLVDHFEEGLIVYDLNKQILTINKIAKEIFQKEETDMNVLEDIPEDFLEAFMSIATNRESFIDIGHKTYYVRKKRITTEDKVFASVIFFAEIERIQDIEKKYRRQRIKQSFSTKYTFEDIRTNDPAMLDLIEKSKRFAQSASTIFIHGETGTGKEIFAHAIHASSPRREEAFVPVNLAAIPDSLAESELFGYEKGAFTGARSDGNIGLFEKAHNGTIFLDEIGDASPTVQNLLLRVLQEQEVQRIGGGQPIPINVRVIVATNKDLSELVKKKRFREDLYFRLKVLPVHIPPLRNRKKDIMLLTNVFSKDFEEGLKRSPLKFTEEVIYRLMNYSWPGNVRELKNTIEYLAHASDDLVKVEELPFYQEYQDNNLNHDIEELNRIIQLLAHKSFLKESYFILKYIYGMKGRGIGRYKLKEDLQDKGIKLTDQQLRYRMEILAEEELIEVRRGRGGSVINEKGLALLQLLDNENIFGHSMA